MKIYRHLLLLLFCTSFLACKKPDLADYKGDQGASGSSAVIHTQVVDLPSSAWSATAQEYIAIIFSDKIDQKIIDKGTVQVYLRRGDQWTPLPLVEGDEFMLFGYELGKVHLTFSHSHSGLPDVPGSQQIKILTVQGQQ
jgi:hypothetical protein